jgi:hypothetical protein
MGCSEGRLVLTRVCSLFRPRPRPRGVFRFAIFDGSSVLGMVLQPVPGLSFCRFEHSFQNPGSNNTISGCKVSRVLERTPTHTTFSDSHRTCNASVFLIWSSNDCSRQNSLCVTANIFMRNTDPCGEAVKPREVRISVAARRGTNQVRRVFTSFCPELP